SRGVTSLRGGGHRTQPTRPGRFGGAPAAVEVRERRPATYTALRRGSCAPPRGNPRRFATRRACGVAEFVRSACVGAGSLRLPPPHPILPSATAGRWGHGAEDT